MKNNMHRVLRLAKELIKQGLLKNSCHGRCIACALAEAKDMLDGDTELSDYGELIRFGMTGIVTEIESDTPLTEAMSRIYPFARGSDMPMAETLNAFDLAL